MTCIYTGARVYFDAYRFVVSADLYEVSNATVIKWNPQSQLFGSLEDLMEGGRTITHVVTPPKFGDWFHREDLGLTVVPTVYITGERR